MSLPNNNPPSSTAGSPNGASQGRVWEGMPVPSFEKRNWLATLGMQKLNTVFDIVRAFSNLTVRGMAGAQFKLSDANAVLDFTNTVLGSGVAANATVFEFQPQTLHGDYYDAFQLIAGVVQATPFHILKPPKHRESFTSETIDGNSMTYVYSDDNHRVATSAVAGSPTETQVCIPRFIVSADSVYAVQLDPSAQKTISGVLCGWIEVLPARVWARKTGT